MIQRQMHVTASRLTQEGQLGSSLTISVGASVLLCKIHLRSRFMLGATWAKVMSLNCVLAV